MKSVFAVVSILAVSVQSFAGNCGAQNLVGEWVRKTELTGSPDVKCGNSVVNEKTVFNFIYKSGKVTGHGLRTTVRSFQACSSKTKTFTYPSVELTSNGSLSIVSEDGAQVVSECVVNADRNQVKISGVVYLRTK